MQGEVSEASLLPGIGPLFEPMQVALDQLLDHGKQPMLSNNKSTFADVARSHLLMRLLLDTPARSRVEQQGLNLYPLVEQARVLLCLILLNSDDAVLEAWTKVKDIELQKDFALTLQKDYRHVMSM